MKPLPDCNACNMNTGSSCLDCTNAIREAKKGPLVINCPMHTDNLTGIFFNGMEIPLHKSGIFHIEFVAHGREAPVFTVKYFSAGPEYQGVDHEKIGNVGRGTNDPSPQHDARQLKAQAEDEKACGECFLASNRRPPCSSCEQYALRKPQFQLLEDKLEVHCSLSR